VKAVGSTRFDFLFHEVELIDLFDQGIKTPERRTWVERAARTRFPDPGIQPPPQ